MSRFVAKRRIEIDRARTLDGPGSPPEQAIRSFKFTRRAQMRVGDDEWRKLPESLRRQLESQLHHGEIVISDRGATTRWEQYTYTDEEGIVHQYNSIEEMPEAIRRKMESMLPAPLRQSD